MTSAATIGQSVDLEAGSLVFMFPGQSSRYPEMIEKACAEDPASATVIARASEILGRDLASHYRADNTEIFSLNRDVQIGVFLANHLYLERIKRAGIHSAWSLGLSLGEYNHLVHIGVLSFEDALRLVDERGCLYDEGPVGVMVSVFPIEAHVVERTIRDLHLDERVVVGLYNAPRQQVLSGERAAVERVVEVLSADALLDAVEIESRIPMHAPLFKPVATKFRAVLARTPLRPPILPYVPNCRAAVLSSATPEEIRDCLIAHVHRPVRWQASVEAVAACVASACFVEVGPRAVLYNLFGRGWRPGRRASTDGAEPWNERVCRLKAEVLNGA